MFKKIVNFFKKVDEKIKNFLFKNRYGTVMVLVGLTVAFWDLILKFLLDGKTLTGLKGIFNIYSTHNTGGAWSIFSGSTIVLIIISIVVIALIIFFNYHLKTKNYFYAISMGLLLSGAFCNLYDRLVYGYVRDFINLEFIKFPVFNIADIAITVGIILLCIYFFFIMPKLEKEKEKEIDNLLENKQQKEEKLSADEITQNSDKSMEKVISDSNQEKLIEKEIEANLQNSEIEKNSKHKNNSKAKNARKE